ncbi:hemolysin-III related-domain-containing protein [Mycena crocata]|nr:hemolysin-III related-domain-containing protein [Mycena crocata]
MATQRSRRYRRRTRPYGASPAQALASLPRVFRTRLEAIRSLLVAAALPLFSFSLFPPTLVPQSSKSKMHADEETPLLDAVLSYEDEDVSVATALKLSCHGDELIAYDNLPAAWRNNPFVEGSYRFIPLTHLPTLLLSIFTPHNEFSNIHTHLVPLLLWGWVAVSAALEEHSDTPDSAEIIFTLAALLCLGSSALWHTMAGCAHRRTMEFCARVDYVGIGWLISASISTIVSYGYSSPTTLKYQHPFLALCFVMAAAGSVLPFMKWFDRYENRFLRLSFFLALVLCAAAPIAGIALLHGVKEMGRFVAPILPTLASCGVGLIFYAAHVPERFLAPGGRWKRRMEGVGFGSHAIFHLCIVLGIGQWRAALLVMRAGVGMDAAA